MSVEALPYTLLLLLAQFSFGVSAAVLYVQLRGTFEPPFIRTCAWLTVFGALCLVLTVLAIDARPAVDGYAIDSDYLGPMRAVSLALLLFTCAHFYFIRREDEGFLANATGATMAGLGLVLMVLCASMIRLPTWSVAGTFLMLVTGGLTLGVTMVAMVWGHWYLVKPSLAEGPLVELTLIACIVLVAELAVIIINAVIPVGTPFDSDALLAVNLSSNPAFWLRVGIGLIFPIALAFMAYKSSQERAMMSATGLLYIAVGAVLAGEALGRGLLFVTGAPV